MPRAANIAAQERLAERVSSGDINSTYVRNDGDGNLTVTHVIWARCRSCSTPHRRLPVTPCTSRSESRGPGMK
jgi:hypothetical protein